MKTKRTLQNYWTRTLLTGLMLWFISPAFTQTATQPAGSGTETEPYQITSLENLYWLTVQNLENGESFLGKHIKLMNDIDASPTATWFDGAGWVCLGEGDPYIGDVPFEGHFDGDHHVISGLTIDRPTEVTVGFFGFTSSNAVVENLGLEAVSITGGNNTGALVGQAFNGIFDNCYAEGAVYGTGVFTGGLFGQSRGNLSNSHFEGH